MLPQIKKDTLIPRLVWHPYPACGDRQAWETLSEELRQTMLQAGFEASAADWGVLPATLFLEFTRNGNRSRYESVHFERRRLLLQLVIAECVESSGRFLDDIANGIWTLCEETYWGIPAHIGVQRAGVGLPDTEEPTVDLFAAETAALLAWTDYTLSERLDQVSDRLRPRIAYEVMRRMLEPCLKRDFAWMGFAEEHRPVNNWNPWVNSNWLACCLLLEADEDRRYAAVEKSLRSLQHFIDVYGESGGCDEGPGYWGRAAASLFDCLELVKSATGGSYDVYDWPKIQNMGRFIYLTHIDQDYYVNFADASAITQPPASLVYRYGKRIHDELMTAFGAWLFARQDSGKRNRLDSLGRVLPEIFLQSKIEQAPSTFDKPEDAWFEDIQVMVARDQQDGETAFFLAAKGGHNAESHNHNDIGNFIFYTDGKPLVVDAGVETYTRKTFSPKRYEIWTMQSDFHSLLPTFLMGDAVIQQAPGREFCASQVEYTHTNGYAQLSLDLSTAYPAQLNLAYWKRTFRLDRGKQVSIHDSFQLLNQVDAVRLSLLTPCRLEVLSTGCVQFHATGIDQQRQSASGRLYLQAGAFAIDIQAIPIQDERLSPVWGDHLNRRA